MRLYRTARKAPIVAFITNALIRSGCRVVKRPSPTEAPFVFEVVSPAGERMRLICYAFLANKYSQKARPSDEHRFQLKYGSDFQDYHYLCIADGRDTVTLMFGCHLDAGVFVAVDPHMHNPTWFSKSIEFKTPEIEATLDRGWHGWERERTQGGRRKRDMPRLDFRTEVLLGFTPEHLFRFIQFERVAGDLDAGHRLLIAEQLAPSSQALQSSEKPPNRESNASLHMSEMHPLEQAWGFSAREILDLIDGAFRLKVAVRGAVAERHLLRILRDRFGRVESIDKDGKPDFAVYHQGQGPFFVECKNVLRRVLADGAMRVDFQKTRASKNDPCSRYYRREEFHVLAACLHPVSLAWEFRYCPTRKMQHHPKCPGRLGHRNVVVRGSDPWSDDVVKTIESLC